jgi:hypothetical protein
MAKQGPDRDISTPEHSKPEHPEATTEPTAAQGQVHRDIQPPCAPTQITMLHRLGQATTAPIHHQPGQITVGPTLHLQIPIMGAVILLLQGQVAAAVHPLVAAAAEVVVVEDAGNFFLT